jgi:predicted naringenin-chalcone synthase
MRILGLGTAVPHGAIEQADAASISCGLLAADRRQARLVESMFRRSGVRRRHSVIVDPDERRAQNFYPPGQGADDRGPGTAARMEQYTKAAGGLAVRAARAGLEDAGLGASDITHLVTVSCTGFHAPGPEITLIDELGLSPEVARVAIGFMGCHGAFNGLRVGDSIVRGDPAARVLVVAVELCSLHFSYAWDSQKLVANALFADGAAAFVCGGRATPVPAGRPALQVDAFGSLLLPDSRDAMSWRIGNHGFEMTLSAGLPALIESQLPAWLVPWLAQRDLHPDAIRWAVHPGGPRILGAVESGLRLPADALAPSRAVLAAYGNMSSATIGFILDVFRDAGGAGPGVALGFGPGLVAEAFVFRLGT